MPEIGLGLGGNVGDPAKTIHAALAALEARGIARVSRVSSLYRTAPWGGVAQPDYANACALAQTDLAPLALLDAIKILERDLGRVDTIRWGPRVIDIDILFYGDLAYQDERLVIPHRDLLRRAFVLVPLAEIAPNLEIAGQQVAAAAAAVGSPNEVLPWRSP